MHIKPGAHCDAINGSDYRFIYLLQFERYTMNIRPQFILAIEGRPLHALCQTLEISSGTKCFVSFSGDHDDIHVRVVTQKT